MKYLTYKVRVIGFRGFLVVGALLRYLVPTSHKLEIIIIIW